MMYWGVSVGALEHRGARIPIKDGSVKGGLWCRSQASYVPLILRFLGAES